MRQDKARTARNSAFEETMKKALKLAKKSPTSENIRLAVKATDKATKHYIIHKNKAARVKSALSKLIAGKSEGKKVATAAKVTKKATVKKSSAKKTAK